MLDLNFVRRRREREIAHDVAREFMRNVTSPETVAPNELLAHHKVVQGQMPKTAAEEFERMGLAPGGVKHITGSSESQVPGGIAGRDQFMANPYEWVQQTLMPALAAHGITSQNDIIAQVSKMFPVRTASQIISEMGLQGRFHEGEQSPFEKDIRLQKGAMGQAGFDELIKNDYSTVLKAFNQQWENLLQTLGSPLMQPGGPVLTAMAALTSTINSMSQFAAVNPEVIKGVAYGLAALSAALIRIPAGLLLGIPAGLTAIGIAVAAWLTWSGTKCAVISWPSTTPSPRFISWLAGIADKVRGLFGNSGNLPGTGNPMGDSGGLKQNQNFKFDPSTSQTKATPINLTLNVDGRTLAQSISEQLDQLYEHATGSPNYNGQSHFGRADGGMTTAHDPLKSLLTMR